MEIITIDFETFYDKDYSLSKLSIEQYVRDPQFQVIMLGLQWPDGTQEVITGTHAEIRYRLDAIDWSKYGILCHNTLFDGAILSWHFGVKPKAWFDTLCMARALRGVIGNSLAALAEVFNVGVKGDYALSMLGKRREDLSELEFQIYATYCLTDVSLTKDLFESMMNGWSGGDIDSYIGPFPVSELKLIDCTIRMFTEPVFRLNVQKLREHLKNVQSIKTNLMSYVEVQRADLMSNAKFAELLVNLGVDPPKKTSPTTGKEAFAFAKTDEGMRLLAEHPDPRVQALVAARTGVKSTLEETRTERFLGIAERGLLPIPLQYCAAHTKRFGGTDKINMQNLPSRGKSSLKESIEVAEGYEITDADSSNIEARGVAWLAGQVDLVEDFARKVDVYCKMATTIYGKPITKADPLERFLGKTVVLGAGYGTGGVKLQATLRVAKPPVNIGESEAKGIINTYRATYPRIPMLWRQAERAIQAMHDDQCMWLGPEGALWVEGNRGIRLPNGLYLKYPQLHRVTKDGKTEWMYKNGRIMTRIFGAKLIENVTQALARIIITDQLLLIAKRYKVALTVHDSIVVVHHKDEREEVHAYIQRCMRWVPPWAKGWPVDCEIKVGDTYGG
jgi:hypothetical protein